MKPIDYLKQQAKNLQKDFKTQTSFLDVKQQRNFYCYDPKFFQFDLIVQDFNIDEENFKLSNAQHIIAKLCGFEKWSEMSKASPSRMQLAILLYDNMDRVDLRDWNQYLLGIESANKVTIDDELKLQIFRDVFLEGEQEVYYDSYRLLPHETFTDEGHNEQIDSTETYCPAKITSLPLDENERAEFIKVANESFERVFDRIEPANPQLTRLLWDAEKFIDQEILTFDKLPIDRDYAISLVDAFIVGHVIQIAADADHKAAP